MGEEKKGFWGRLVEGLSKTRDNIVSGIDSIFSGFSSIDDDFYEEIEEILIMGDIGVNATESIIESLKEKVKENHIKDPAECKELLINSIKEQMDVGETAYRFENEKSVVLVIGVNGVGKTTSVGKLAGKLKDQGKKVVLAAADTFRAAAGDQLLEWANRAGVEMIGGQEGADPASIVYDAVAAAKARNADVLLCDTAGRLHVDEDMMAELIQIKENVAVSQTILVVDAMTGQDAVNVAKEFNEKVGVDGIIITKMDGDTRGGAALSIRSVTGKPILYVGMGEKLEDLQQFYPDRMTSRILGMGDVMSLIEKAEAAVDQEAAQEMSKKLKKMDFDFNDYLTSLEQMNKMGGISSILNMLPGVGSKMKDVESMIDEKAMDRTKSIILSMTPQERSNPGILNLSRKNRIARGAGVDVAEVNRLVKQFEQSKKMMKQMPGLMGGGKMGGKRGGFKLPF
mgnify:CR=1 FL=1